MWQKILLVIGIMLEAGILTGLVARRRVRAAVLLPVWLVAHMGVSAALLVRPSLMTWAFWNAKHAAFFVLDGLLILEVAARMGTNLAGVRRWLTLGIAASGVFITWSLHVTSGHPFTTWVLPVLAAGVAALCLWTFVTAIVMLLPLDPLHRVLLVGLVVVSMLYAVTWAGVRDDTSVAAHVNVYAFVVLLAALLQVAWRPVGAHGPELPRRFLWPWHA